MIRYFLVIAMTLCFVRSGMAQVGIGTSGTVDASAKLQIDADNKGFLPPRVNLTGTTDVTTIPSPATGLLVFNLATAGTESTSVTPGFYYHDGVRWQRIINTPEATVTFNGTNPATATTFTDGPAASTRYIYVSDTDNSQWTWNGTSYVTYTPPASTPWYLTGGIKDAGSNKSGTVYRTGSVGIGATTTPDASAQLDVNSTSKGFLPPRVALTATNAAGPITSPATGLLVYNTATAGTSPNNVSPGYYFNSGTAASPTWSAVQVVTPTTGVETGKIVYNKTTENAGTTAQSISVGQLSFSYVGGTQSFRLTSNPGTTVTVYANQVENWNGGGYSSGTYSSSFTTSDWSTWKALGSGGVVAPGEVNTFYITCSNEDKAYRVTFWIQGAGSRYNYVILVERF